jgi:hypothetical protein
MIHLPSNQDTVLDRGGCVLDRGGGVLDRGVFWTGGVCIGHGVGGY